MCEALRCCAPPPSPKGIDDEHGASSDNMEETISDKIAGATRTLMANHDRIATLEEKVSQIQLLLTSYPQHTFTGASFIRPDNIPHKMQFEHQVSPERQASLVSPQRIDGQSHTTPMRAEGIDGQKLITLVRAQPSDGKREVPLVRSEHDVVEGDVPPARPDPIDVVHREVTPVRIEPDVVQAKMTLERPDPTDG